MSVKFQMFLVILNVYCAGGISRWTNDKTLSTKAVARQMPGTINIEVRKKPSTSFNWHYFPSTKLNKLEHFFTESIYTKRKKETTPNKVTAEKIQTRLNKITRTNKMSSEEDDIVFKSTNSITSTLNLDVTMKNSETSKMISITKPIATSSEENISTSSNENTAAAEKKKVPNNNKLTRTSTNKMTSQEDYIALKSTNYITSTLDFNKTMEDSDTNEMSALTMATTTSSEENIIMDSTKTITPTLDLDVTMKDSDTSEMSTITKPIATSFEENISTSSNENTAPAEKIKVTNNNKITRTSTNKMTSQEDDIVLKSTNSITSTLHLDVTMKDSDSNEMSTLTMATTTSSEENISTSNNINTANEKKKVTNNNKITIEAKKNKKESKATKNGKSDNTKNGGGNKKIRREKKNRTLNPYDLNNDLLEVMNYFPNVNVSAKVIGRSVEYKDIVMLKITDAIGDKKVGRADVNELKKDRGEGIDTDVETTDTRNNIDTGMQNQDTKKGFGGEEEIKKGDTNKSEEITSEVDAEGKKIIFIVHGLSTFELWKIPCLCETNQLKILISFYLSHLKNFDIFLIPVANPDGFARKDNHWNKNMSPQEDCGGVALDRNFDIAWASKSNVSSCDQLYPGSKPFSEAETEAIKDVFLRYGKRMAAYINVHATDNNFDYRGNTILIPKGYTDEASDEDKYLDLKGEIDEAMRKVFNLASVNIKTIYSWYGPVAGTSVDYAAEVIGVPFAMEFLMQPYQGSAKGSLNRASLTHIWKRVIDIVFTFIHKINNSDESD